MPLDTIIPSDGDGLWSKIWNDIKTSSTSSSLSNKTVLILATSSKIHNQIISKLESSEIQKNNTLFSTRKKKLDNQSIVDGYGLGYTFIQSTLNQNDVFNETKTLDIYTFTYPADKNEELISSFLKRFKDKNDLTVIDLIDIEPYTLDPDGVLLEKLFEETGSMCRIINGIFSNELSNEIVMQQFKKLAPLYNEHFTSSISTQEYKLSKGHGDYPIGVDYILCVLGTDSLSSQTMINLTQVELDKLQQLLRLLMLKIGGALAFLPNLTMNNNANEKLVQQNLQTYLSDKESKLKSQVDDVNSLFIPRGWDTWGKIRVLNDGFNFEHWSDKWEQIVSNKEPTRVESPLVENFSLVEENYQEYQNFLKNSYKIQLENELAASSAISPIKHAISPKKEFAANSSMLNEDHDVSITSFHETHSMLQDFRLQFLENDADLLSGLQSTPGPNRFQDNIPLGSNAAKFKDFFSDLLAKENQ